jgi:hypothetical protein
MILKHERHDKTNEGSLANRHHIWDMFYRRGYSNVHTHAFSVQRYQHGSVVFAPFIKARRIKTAN